MNRTMSNIAHPFDVPVPVIAHEATVAAPVVTHHGIVEPLHHSHANAPLPTPAPRLRDQDTTRSHQIHDTATPSVFDTSQNVPHRRHLGTHELLPDSNAPQPTVVSNTRDLNPTTGERRII